MPAPVKKYLRAAEIVFWVSKHFNGGRLRGWTERLSEITGLDPCSIWYWRYHKPRGEQRRIQARLKELGFSSYYDSVPWEQVRHHKLLFEEIVTGAARERKSCKPGAVLPLTEEELEQLGAALVYPLSDLRQCPSTASLPATDGAAMVRLTSRG